MSGIDRPRAIRATVLMAVVLAPIFVLLAVTLDKAFFEDWGWLAGPGVWLACGLLVGVGILKLPADRVAAATLLSGLPSLLFVVIGLHDVGPLLSLPAYGALIGHIPVNS